MRLGPWRWVRRRRLGVGETRPVFSVGNMPDDFDVASTRFQKKVLTRAFRMDGPFAVDMRSGLARCEDGWLAIDDRGEPYPIDADEFALIYEAEDV